MDLYVIALSRFKRQKYDSALELCDKMLKSNPNDQAAWILKCHSLIRKHYLDDLEMDEENAGDILLDENSMTSVARPGTSFSRPLSTKDNPNNPNPILRPVSKGGRGSTGYARTNTNRLNTSSQGIKVQTALRGSRLGTNRAVTSGGKILQNSYYRSTYETRLSLISPVRRHISRPRQTEHQVTGEEESIGKSNLRLFYLR